MGWGCGLRSYQRRAGERPVPPAAIKRARASANRIEIAGKIVADGAGERRRGEARERPSGWLQ